MFSCRLNVLVAVIFFVIFLSYGEHSEAIKLSTKDSNSSHIETFEYLNSICGQENGAAEAWGRFPWIVAILSKKDDALNYICLGNLISSKTLVAAANCLADKAAEELVVSMNWYNQNNWSDANNLEVDKKILLPDDTEDLAILRLKQSVPFTDSVNPICLWQGPEDANEIKDASGVVMSWGPKGRGKTKAVPKLVTVTVNSDLACLRSNMAYLPLLRNGTFCGEHEEGSDGLCIGDGGSGFMIKKGNKWMLRAILSFQIIGSSTENGCFPGKTSIYSDAVAQKEWIRSNIL